MGWERDYQWEAELRRLMGANSELHDAIGAEWKGEAPKAYRMGALHALVSRDEVAPGDLRWHVSVSRKDRVPTLDEVVKTAHGLRPGVVFVVPVPPKSWWINLHENCLHVHEVKDAPLIDQWRAERQGHEQTAGRRYA